MTFLNFIVIFILISVILISVFVIGCFIFDESREKALRKKELDEKLESLRKQNREEYLKNKIRSIPAERVASPENYFRERRRINTSSNQNDDTFAILTASTAAILASEPAKSSEIYKTTDTIGASSSSYKTTDSIDSYSSSDSSSSSSSSDSSSF